MCGKAMPFRRRFLVALGYALDLGAAAKPIEDCYLRSRARMKVRSYLVKHFCFFVMFSDREALGIVRDFTAIGFICLDGGEAKQSDRDIDRALYADAGKTEGRRGWTVPRH